MNINPTLDGVLKRYLLGTADSEVREDVEKRLFSDDRISLGATVPGGR